MDRLFHVPDLSWARQAVLVLFSVSQLQEVVWVMSPRKPEQPVGQGDWRIMPWLLQAVVMLKSWASPESGERRCVVKSH